MIGKPHEVTFAVCYIGLDSDKLFCAVHRGPENILPQVLVGEVPDAQLTEVIRARCEALAIGCNEG